MSDNEDILADYDIDLNEVESPSFGGQDVPDDIYEFIVGNAWLQVGSQKDKSARWIIIEYILGEGGELKKSELFGLPKSPRKEDWTDTESMIMGFLKDRIGDLGQPVAKLTTEALEALVGTRGTLQVFHNKKGYQNIKNVRVDAGASAAAAAPVSKPLTTTRRKPAAKPAPKVEAPVAEAPAEEQAEASEETAEVAAPAPAVAAPKTASGRPNPFAKQR